MECLLVVFNDALTDKGSYIKYDQNMFLVP